MGKSYLHGIIILFWVILTVVLSIPPIPVFVPIIWTIYSLVVIWFLVAWRRDDLINIGVKIVSSIGMMLCFFLLFGSACDKFRLLDLPKGTPRYIMVSNVISNTFVIYFIAALIVSPLLISIFHKHYMYISLIIATPTICFKPFFNFLSISKSSYTIGIYSAQILAVIVATYISSLILHRFLKPGTSNQRL